MFWASQLRMIARAGMLDMISKSASLFCKHLQTGRAAHGGDKMIKVKTFTNEIRVMHVMKELAALDAQVNEFLSQPEVKSVISVSDSCTSGDGSTIGIIRVVTYQA